MAQAERLLPRRGRRWMIAATIFALVLVIGGWWVNRQLEPKRLTALVLDKAGASLGLTLSFKGEPDYAFNPEPRLLIPDLEVRNPADGKLFLSAQRAEISLPWDTITGGEPVITRLELDTPVLDLPGLRRWQATRPPTPFKLPTLTRGLRITHGLVRDDGYRISALSLDLPRLRTGETAAVDASGVFVHGTNSVAFDIAMTAATPGLESEFTLAGSGELMQKPQPLPFKLQSAGRYRVDDTAFNIEAKSLGFEGNSPLPNLDGQLSLRIADTLGLKFTGTLKHWVKDWPALPAPLDAGSKPMPLTLEYLGASDLSAPLSISLTPENASFVASLRIAEMQRWIDASDASLLPPLDATLTTPTLQVEGFTLEGVDIEIRDSAPAETKP